MKARCRGLRRSVSATFALLAALWLPGAAAAADLGRGAALYDAHCLSCHGPAQAPTNATSLTARNLGPVLRDGIANARSGMLFLGDILSASDIDDIAAFLGNTPAAIDFGAQSPDEAPTVRSVLVRAGRENLERLSVRVQGEFVRVGGSCGDRVVGNTACTVDLSFRPQGLGARTGAVLLAHSGLSTPARIDLSGTGAPPVRAAFDLATDRVEFGAAVIGGTALTRSLLVRNGGSQALRWTAPVLAGAHPGDFSVGNGTCRLDTPLDAGAQCTLDLAFRPLATGERSAVLRLSSADGLTQSAVTLDGAGQQRPVGRLAVDVQRLDFGPQPAGTASAPREVLLLNQGSAPLRLLSAVAPVGFQVDGDCVGRSLAVGGACRLMMRFAPAALGPVAGEWLLLSDGEVDRLRLPLSGEGVRAVPQLAWAPATPAVVLAASPVGRAALAEPVQLLNPGPEAVTLLRLDLDGLHAADFAVDSRSTCSAGRLLPAGAACTVVIEGMPGAVGRREARLTLQATGETPQVLALAVEGLPAPLALPVATAGNLGGGGCTLGHGHPAFDPVWPLLILAAAAVLAVRRCEARGPRRGAREHPEYRPESHPRRP